MKTMSTLERRKYHCWVKNLTKMKIVLSDLRYTLQPYRVHDLLDYKHSDLTVEEVEKSLANGSLAKRIAQKKVVIKLTKPEPIVNKQLEVSKLSYPSRVVSGVTVENKVYKELEIELNDDEFAKENADASIEEHKPKINLRETTNNNESLLDRDNKK